MTTTKSPGQTERELRRLHRRGPLGPRDLRRLWLSYFREERERAVAMSEYGSASKSGSDLAICNAVNRWNRDVENLCQREPAM